MMTRVMSRAPLSAYWRLLQRISVALAASESTPTLPHLAGPFNLLGLATGVDAKR
jgi:hypothetical protein